MFLLIVINAFDEGIISALTSGELWLLIFILRISGIMNIETQLYLIDLIYTKMNDSYLLFVYYFLKKVIHPKVENECNKDKAKFECYVFYVNLHYPNQFICSKKSYLSYIHILHKVLYLYIMSTYAHPIIIILSVQKKA